MSRRRFAPHRVGHLWIVGRHEMRQDQGLDARLLRHTTRIFGRGLMREDARLECRGVRHSSGKPIDSRWVHDRVYEDIGAGCELHEILRRRCIARDHEGAITCAEPELAFLGRGPPPVPRRIIFVPPWRAATRARTESAIALVRKLRRLRNGACAGMNRAIVSLKDQEFGDRFLIGWEAGTIFDPGSPCRVRRISWLPLCIPNAGSNAELS
jgi:hypothetical protein